MKIKIFSIEKKKRDLYDDIFFEISKMSKQFASLDSIQIFNNSIANAQRLSPKEAKKAYLESYKNELSSVYNVALDEKGISVDSFEFSEILKDRSEVHFFIGGAFGFCSEFLGRCDRVISLSRLTFSHKIARIVLAEQVYRGLSIINNHPYHKD